jgi:hypoxanthine phosphoribosyltransferase
MTEKKHIGWGEIQQHVERICGEVKNSGIPYKSVVGIQRGGLNLSMPLADCLGIKHRSVKVSLYDGDKRRDEPMVDVFDLDIREKPFLIADDLIDSGSTIKYLSERYGLKQGEDYHIAVIHWNKENESGLQPDYYGEEKPNAWVVYPWETE